MRLNLTWPPPSRDINSVLKGFIQKLSLFSVLNEAHRFLGVRTVKKSEDAAISGQKSGKRKWLSRIGTFLIMGGWLLIAVLVIAIIIIVSVVFK